MDPEGWVPLTLIASFYRIRNMTTDLGLIAEVKSSLNQRYNKNTSLIEY